MLTVSNLSFDYYDKPLLAKVDFSLAAGGLLHVCGENGSGKTTLLKLLAGLYHPHEGGIYFNGQAIDANLQSYQRQLCYLGHKPGINTNLTVAEHCYFDTRALQNPQTTAGVAAVFGLDQQLNTLTGLLSAGQRRQVALLGLWMTSASLWLLDEPLVALDEKAQKILIQHLAWHRSRGGAVIMTSHQALPLAKADYEEYHLS